jgi:PEP-CTERM motif
MKISFRPTQVGLNPKWSIPLLALGLLLVLVPSSQATLIGLTPTPDGATISPLVTTEVPPLSTLVLGTDRLINYSFNTTAGTTKGTIETAIYREFTGTLDFYYQVANSASSATSIARETNTNFGSFTTDTGYRIDGSTLTGTKFVDGTVPPVFADRNMSGNVNGFLFDLLDSTKIFPGTTSSVLIIATNATRYTMGNSEVIDGGTQTVPTWQPTSIPEPGSMLLIGGGLLALAGIRRFRS